MIHELPNHDSGYADYRVICDHESDDRHLWSEVEMNGSPIHLSPGDLVIICP